MLGQAGGHAAEPPVGARAVGAARRERGRGGRSLTHDPHIVTPRPLRAHQVRPLAPSAHESGLSPIPPTAGAGQHGCHERAEWPDTGRHHHRSHRQRAARQPRGDARRQSTAPLHQRPLHRGRRRRPGAPLRRRPHDHPRAPGRADLLRRRRRPGVRRRVALRPRGRPGPRAGRHERRGSSHRARRRRRDRADDRLRQPLLRRRLGLGLPAPAAHHRARARGRLRHARQPPGRRHPQPAPTAVGHPAGRSLAARPGRNRHDRHRHSTRHPTAPAGTPDRATAPPDPTPPGPRPRGCRPPARRTSPRRGPAAPAWCSSGRPWP